MSSASTAPKPAKTFTAIMTGRGKGAKTHAEQERRDRTLKPSKPIGFDAVADDVSGSVCELHGLPAKHRTLGTVGFTSPLAVSKPLKSSAEARNEGGAA